MRRFVSILVISLLIFSTSFSFVSTYTPPNSVEKPVYNTLGDPKPLSN